MFEYYARDYFKSNNPAFIKACQAVPFPWGKKDEGIPPTKRQASKFLRGKGIAYKVMHNLV